MSICARNKRFVKCFRVYFGMCLLCETIVNSNGTFILSSKLRKTYFFKFVLVI